MKAERFFLRSQGIVLILAVLLFSSTGYHLRAQAGVESGLQLELPPEITSPVQLLATASQATDIAAGKWHTCALTEAGGVKCWGDNYWGQLGDGTWVDRYTPVDVSGLTSGVSAVAVGGVLEGGEHTCALTQAGGVKCWGANGVGQLGDGTDMNRNTPVEVNGLSSGVVAITAGNYHTCALTQTGGVKCWGYNEFGQLGDGTWDDRFTPVDVSGLNSGVSAISTGGNHTCAMTASGGIKCWGANYSGQLGDGTDMDKNTPVEVNGLSSGVTAISAGGGETCALMASGGVKCWGDNGHGQIGDGTNIERYTPVVVSGLTSGVDAIDVGSEHACALTQAGGVKCWGYNRYGQLGDGTRFDWYTPNNVSGLFSGVSAISAGGRHTCAMTQTGGVKCWGDNEYGQLGDGHNATYATPVEVSGMSSGVSAIDAGSSHTCALTEAGGVKCWGINDFGQLGDGTTFYRDSPVNVSGLSSEVSAIAAGGYHTCALMDYGGVKCWGQNVVGQLGDGTSDDRLTPVDVFGLSSGVSAISAGGGHTCALMASGVVKCWGIGYGHTPVDVSGLSSGVSAIDAGSMHTCALTQAGGVKCWGQNDSGQLGDGTNTSSLTPVDVSGLTSGVSAIAAGGGHTCALMASGGAKCWGSNGSSQLGDGTWEQRLTPVEVSGLSSGVSDISAEGDHTCALMASGGVKCWGWNEYGQLGDGTWDNQYTPVDVSGLSIGVSAISAGRKHTCALNQAGGVKCWGDNYWGQLGLGIASILPHWVVGFEELNIKVYAPLVIR